MGKFEYYAKTGKHSKALWLELCKLPANEQVRYHVARYWTFEEEIDIARMKKALQVVVDGNWDLRSNYFEEDGEIYLGVRSVVDAKTEYVEVDREAEKGLYLQRMIQSPFDLAKDNLFRFALVKDILNNQITLIMIFNHIITDGSIRENIGRQIEKAYIEKANPTGIGNDEAGLQVLQAFLVEEANEVIDQEGITYWKNKLIDKPLRVELPWDGRNREETFQVIRRKLTIRGEVYGRVQEFCRAHEVSIFNFMQAIAGVIACRYSGAEEVIIGYPVNARRSHKELKGFCIDELPYVFSRKGNFLAQVQKLRAEIPPRAARRVASWDLSAEVYGRENEINVVLANSLLHKFDFPQLGNAVENDFETNIGNADLSISYAEVALGIDIVVTSVAGVLNPEMLTQLGQHLELLMDRVTANGNWDKPDSSLLRDEEYNKIVYEWNQTASEYENDKTIQQLFEEQVAKNPDQVAVVFADQALTYRELNQKANQVAGKIRSYFTDMQDQLIGIYIERSMEMIIGILGVLKSGGAYVPIDPSEAQERLKYKLGNAECQVILTDEKSKVTLSQVLEEEGKMGKVALLCLDTDWEEINQYSGSNVENLTASTDLAYVIYTSGSTGIPKGVMIEHYGVLNLAKDIGKKFDIQVGTRVLQCASVSFDASVYESFGALLNGGCLVVNGDYTKLNETLIDKQVEVVMVTPSVLTTLEPGDLKSVRTLVVGAEACSQELAEEHFKVRTFINAYGPTEATVASLLCKMEAGKKLSIGQGIANKKHYILDDNLQPVPIGVGGELHIGGDGLARGYLKNPELTAEKFIANPFVNQGQSERMYKTGDLCRWLPDGNIEFIGRTDFQVKIRGFRIEMGEIENTIGEYDGVSQAVVLVRENNNNKYLVAYYTLTGEKIIDQGEMKEYVTKKLPDYMIPAQFIYLPEMPLNTSGKIDRKQLPVVEFTGNEQEYVAPGTEVEKTLCRIWSKVLGLTESSIGITDNFFSLGGNSISAIRLANQIGKEFGLHISVAELFANAEIGKLSTKFAGYDKEIKITLTGRKKAPLSFAQEQLYFIDGYEGGSNAYNISLVFELEAQGNMGNLQQALAEIIGENKILQTRYNIDPETGETYQEVDDEKIQIGVARVATKVEVGERIKKYATYIFDLKNENPLKIEIIECDKTNKMYLNMVVHHIAFDGWSVDIWLNAVEARYEQISQEGMKENQTEENKASYIDYALWQREYLQGEELTEQLKYWQDKLVGYENSNIASDKPRPNTVSYSGKNQKFRLGKEVTAAIRKLAKDYKTTEYVILLSAFYVLLSKYSGDEDIVIGTPSANRHYRGVEDIMGFFVNSLALRIQGKPEETIAQLIEKVQQETNEAQRNQDTPFSKIVEELGIEKDMSRHPIFQVMFGVQSLGRRRGNKALFRESTDKEIVGNVEQIAKFDLELFIDNGGEEYEGSITFATSLYEQETIERMAGHYSKIVEELAQEVNNQTYGKKQIKEIQILHTAEYQKIVYEWNRTERAYPQDKTIHQLFEEQVAIMPDDVAVVFRDTTLTYGQLNEKANKIARAIRAYYPNMRDQLIGIYIDRSIEMIAGILGILKSGGAYVPIDPSEARERLEFKLQDAACQVIVTDQKNKKVLLEILGEKVKSNQVALLCLDGDWGNIDKFEGSPLEKVNGVTDLAYVIYTSGSTGMPKGVMVEHRNIINTIVDRIAEYNFTEKERVMLFAKYVFDASVEQIFTTLCSAGGCLYLPEEGTILSKEALESYLVDNRITHLDVTPSFLSLLDDDKNYAIKRVIVSGEECPGLLIEKWKKIAQVHNVYGPTESAVDTTAIMYDANSIVDKGLIGKPIANTQCYILDKNTRPVPIGVAGELYIGGHGLARGYLNNPELTGEKFISNPFVQLGVSTDQSTRVYRTGDLCRYQPDGNIEFLGRTDFQVKIRGFRIELGEIENALLEYEKINHAIVIAKEKNGNKYLVGYYTLNFSIAMSAPQELTEYLRKKLPDYMIPAQLVCLEEMPLNTSGKVDRKKLPDVEFIADANQYVAPRTAEEEKMVVIWQEVLGTEHIGIDDNFFTLGGHSLKVTQLAARLQKAFGMEFPFAEIFRLPTVRQLSEVMFSWAPRVVKAILPALDREYYPLPSAQKRMYVMDQMEGIGAAYNMTSAYIIEGRLDKGRLSQAIDCLIGRHEALRTSFSMVDGQPVQKVYDKIKNKPMISQATEEDMNQIIDGFVRRFDLSRPPLFRLELVELHAQKYVLLFDIHHIIFDGLSMNVFIKELFDSYAGKVLPAVRLQYRDFAVWQNELLQSAEIIRQEEYWLNIFAGELPVLNLPLDFQRPAKRSYEGDVAKFYVDQTLAARVKTLGDKQQVTLFMLYLTAFSVLLYKYTGQEDIIIGSPVSGRSHADLEEVVGMFVGTLPYRNSPAPGKTFRELLGEVREHSLAAADQQDYPLEWLVEKLNLKRDNSRNPLFDVMFTFFNASATENLEVDDLIIKPYPVGRVMAQFDLIMQVLEEYSQTVISLTYCTKLFRPATVERMGQHFLRILEVITENPEIRLADIEMLTNLEKRQLLQEFNDTYMEYPKNKTIQELFGEMAKKYPVKPALVYKDTTYTYGELDAKTNQLARGLRQQGIGVDDIVGIMVNRSADVMIGILAVLKAGGAYLPIDPDYPPDRIQYMLADSGAKTLLSQDGLRHKAIGFEGNWLDLGDEDLYQGDNTSLENINKPSDLVYIIYTSGSTGKPKGVMIEHRNLANLCTWHNDNQHYHVSATDNAAEYISFGFDASVVSMIPFIVCGATLHIIGDDLRLAPVELNAYFEANQITISVMPTQFCEQFIELVDNKSLRILATGGDKLKVHKPRNYCLVNEYGPTEYTVMSNSFVVDKPYDNIPIGKPVGNTWLYVLDSQGKLQPVGVPGELCIAGAQIARGYLHRPELTAEKFVPNPYTTGEINAKMYKTGDLVRWLPDGNIEFLGRIDQQVKIRGYRIELGEIEQQLLKHPRINETVVEAVDISSTKYLVAYVVPEGGEENLDLTDIKNFLAIHLPEYMVPSWFISLAAIPLTANGKIDRRALPAPDLSELQQGDDRAEYQAVSTETEEKIAKVWCEVLGISDIGVNDNFFSLGGHSLKAVTVVAKLQSYFEISVNQLFEHQTIAELAKHVRVNHGNLRLKLAEMKEKISLPVKAEDTAITLAIEGKKTEYQEANQCYRELDVSAIRNYGAILLTGATGYLGIHLLRELLENTNSHIFLPIRGKNPEDGRQRLLKKAQYYFGNTIGSEMLHSARITVLISDLQAAQLGLEPKCYQQLVNEVDGIIHSAANVRHYGHYQEFWNSNVQATLELLQLAKTGRPKDFHHISTISVGNDVFAEQSFALFTEYELEMGQRLENYYLKTKLEAEKVVAAAREEGVNTNIYRVGNIVFNSENGMFQENIEENAFYLLMKAFVNIGAVPNSVNAEFSFVDQLAKAVVKLAHCQALENQIHHLFNHHQVNLAEVLCDPALSLNIRSVDFISCIDYLYEHYEKPGFKGYVEQIMLHFGWMDDEVGAGEKPARMIVLADKTNQLLGKLGFAWQRLMPVMLTKMIHQALQERTGVLGQSPVFETLSGDDLAWLAGQAGMRLYRDSHDILWQGENNKEFYLIMEGFMEISQKSIGGWYGTIGVISAGDFIGEEAIFGETPSSITAEAILDDVLVLVITGDHMAELIGRSPQSALGIVKAMSNKLRRLEKMIVSMA